MDKKSEAQTDPLRRDTWTDEAPRFDDASSGEDPTEKRLIFTGPTSKTVIHILCMKRFYSVSLMR